MQNSMYSALFGALSNEHRLNSIATNLANVHTTGYKRDLLSFRDTFLMYAHDQIMEAQGYLKQPKLFPEPVHLARSRIGYVKTDFEQGALKVSDAPFDLAIAGDGFFKVRTPQGDFYTRNGHFLVTQEGTLVNEQGFPVLGDGGEITVPPGVRNFTVAESGGIYADGELIGQIGLVDVERHLDMEKLGGNMYRVRPGMEVAEVEAGGYVLQGFLEASNVSPVYEMVNMIEAQRQYEAYAKVMQTTEAVDKETISRVGRARA
ncbi:MAG: flagellar basal-body rod protein FlgF [Desulfovibrio sp.]|jgi:flagellar basal-body rod protein FlgG|nr:flagellar basal-body rod protein FlgF [Desulfovibrio sp.]